MANEDARFRVKFLDDLIASDTVADPEWLTAFRDIPRGSFVPYFFTQRPAEPGWVLIEQPSTEWTESVYSMRALITQLDGDDDNADRARRGRVTGIATSSSSAPPLMALMLRALDTSRGQRVLEIGTGSGYNAALLCHRLGPQNVTSIDIDGALVRRARERLAAFDYAPHLAAIGATMGCRSHAPYDRILSTVGIARIPGTWIQHTRLGGKILVPLDLAGRGGLLALLTVYPDGTAEGPFLPDYGGFMSERANQHHAADTFDTVTDDEGQTRTTTLAVDSAIGGAPFEFFAALMVGGYDWLTFAPADGRPVQTWLSQRGGSWACHTTDPNGNHTIRQGGPVRLWDRIETAYEQWRELGQPVRHQFGLTVHHGKHAIWLDNPGGPRTWDLTVPG